MKIRILMVGEFDVDEWAGRFAEDGFEVPYNDHGVDMQDLDVDAFVQTALDSFREAVQPTTEFGLALHRVDGVDKLTPALREVGTEVLP